MTQYHGLGRHIGFQYCQYAPGRILDSISTPSVLPISALVYYNVNITPLASGHWKYASARGVILLQYATSQALMKLNSVIIKMQIMKKKT